MGTEEFDEGERVEFDVDMSARQVGAEFSAEQVGVGSGDEDAVAFAQHAVDE